MFPGAQRMNRGNHEIPALVHACKANNVTDLVIVHETRGQPGMHVSPTDTASSPSTYFVFEDPCCWLNNIQREGQLLSRIGTFTDILSDHSLLKAAVKVRLN